MKRGFSRRTFEYRWKKRKKKKKKVVYVLIPFISMLWNSFVNEYASYLFVSNSFGDAVYEIFQKAFDVFELNFASIL